MWTREGLLKEASQLQRCLSDASRLAMLLKAEETDSGWAEEAGESEEGASSWPGERREREARRAMQAGAGLQVWRKAVLRDAMR